MAPAVVNKRRYAGEPQDPALAIRLTGMLPDAVYAAISALTIAVLRLVVLADCRSGVCHPSSTTAGVRDGGFGGDELLRCSLTWSGELGHAVGDREHAISCSRSLFGVHGLAL